MKDKLIWIVLILLLAACAKRHRLFPNNNFETKIPRMRPGDNCGGFVFKENGKNNSDSAKIDISVISCIDHLPIPIALVKFRERSSTEEFKLRTDKNGRINQNLPIGFYRLETLSIHYNVVSTPLLLLSNQDYKIYFYLGVGDPLID